MIQSIAKVVTSVIVLIFMQSAFSKEMPQRLGIGIKDNTSKSLPWV